MSSSSRFLMILSPSSPLLLHHRHPTSSLLRLTRHRMQLSFFRQHHFPPPCPLQPSTRNKKDSSSFLPRPSPRHFHAQTASSNFANSSVLTSSNHPWPEFSNLLNNISAAGYFNSPHTSNELAADASLFPEEFLVVLNACLAFARDKPDLLRLLSRKEIEAVVFNGKPFLFKDGEETARRLMVFLNSGESNVADGDKANTFDLMRFLLSYASNVTFSSDRTSLYNTELVESSVRHLLGELAKLSQSQPVSNYSEHDPNRQMARSFGPNIEMKRGDWICPRCNFMNFARNVKCLECEEARPKRQLTGGEWECPQCDFFNYGRNTVCLRCDCKRPGQISLGNAYSRPGLANSNETSSNKADLDRRLAANEEKAQRWFSKVSQLEGTDMSSATADEDFPEIMPLRRGVNRFVVSTRKSPLERRLADAQYRRNMDNDGIPERNNFQTGEVNKIPGAKVSRSLDEVLGRSSSTSGSSDGSINTGVENSPFSTTMQDGHPIGTKSNYIPFVPLPADMFAKKPENFEVHDSLKAVSNDHKTVASNTVGQMDAVSGRKDLQESLQSRQHSEKESIDREVEQAEKSERWFKKVAELHNVTDLATAIPDEDFPEIMPMRKGENKFVVSRNKDRSLTSPTYKRRVATEQAGNTNYVPFVPFPPDYFAKKDKPQANGTDSSAKAAGEPSTYLTPGKPSDKLSEMSVSDDMQPMQNQQMQSWSLKPSGDTADRAQTGGYSNPKSINPQTSNNDSRKHATDSLGSSPPQSGYQNVSSSRSGKSLEGSAVKEPDPLDMSEEAKAERWFRRVAQIKDISELSQIPDEDFPSIMPMRKGVNRFVVSKRKTPLERRLTSQQYRRNLPDPGKEETDSNSN
ncbi:VARIEGATED 3, Organelle Zinc finger 1 [Hibiscus trionum]|uniref:VARIEGATED 3, Organelle Zinc finger 1 n=1 Tax=Hibiscus trionum TaxID=183268 RepID=A0A9W7IF60_HIBTR|nr:VARIEGATED 3, Organelle Zinc finger 1 [Hibiscus trionum]